MSISPLSNPDWWIEIQPCWCPELVRCIWFNSTCIGLNQPPMLASIAYLDMSGDMWELEAWRTHLILCTWHFLHHNKELASAVLIWTADVSSGLFPGTCRVPSCSAACFSVALFSGYAIKLCTIFTLIYFSLHSQLHFIKHGTYG
jgi:hypothetical protein